MKKRILSMLMALVMLATLLPLGLIDTAEAATGAQILTPTSGTSGTGANGGTWKCSSAGDTLTLTDYDGYPIETDATTIRFSGTNTITVPLSNLSGALRVYGLKLSSTKDIWIRGEDGSSLNIVFTPGSGTEDVGVSGIDAEGPLLIDTAGDITISAPYGYPYGIRARQGLDYSGSGALDITVKGSYFWKSQHWCAAYGIAAEKGAISLSGSGSKTIRVQSGANTQQISSTPYGIYHGGGTGSSGTATISVDTGALHIEMNGDGCGIYNMGSADSAYVNINNVPELSIEKADSAIETAHSGTVNVRNSKLRIADGRYAMQISRGTVNMENAEVNVSVRGSDTPNTGAAVYAGTLQVKGSSTVDMTATYGTVVYARAVSVNLSNGSFTAKTGQSKWPPIDAPVTLGAKTRLMTGVCSDADTGKYAGTQVDDLYVTSFASVESGTCGENVKWTLTKDGTLTISGTGAMADYSYSNSTPWYSFWSRVKTAIIENGVTSIGNHAFYGCSSLTSVTIPNSVTSIGGNAFHDCSSLTDVDYDGYGTDWLAVKGHNEIPNNATIHFKDDLYGKGECGENVNWTLTTDGTLTISGTGATADYLGGRAPWVELSVPVKTVVIENGVTSIGTHAFYNCKSLSRVTIPDSVTSIGRCAFSHCIGLTSVTIPSSVTSIEDSAFSGCGLTSVTIPNGVTCIEYNTFYECESLTSVTIPDSVTTISAAAFENCTSLTSVIIPDSVTSIGNYAFSVCTSLTSVTIPNSVTSIGNSAFSYCSSLTSVTIPNSVTSIGNHVFSNCTSLTSVTIPSSVTSIGNGAFSGCTSLTSVTIPSSVTSIGDGAFKDCTALTDVWYGGSETDWLALDGHDQIPGSAAVHFKDNLYDSGSCGESVNWTLTGDGTLTISGTGAMANYTYDHTYSNSAPWYSFRSRVKTVIIENGVTGIGTYAFYDCSSLTSVTIPVDVTRIGEYTFSDCSSLTDVYYDGYGTDWMTVNGRNEIPNNATIHFKDGLYGKGECGVNVNWRLDENGTLTISGTGRISNYTYNSTAPWSCYIPYVKSLIIEDGVRAIGSYAFYDCKSLTSVTIPTSVTSIGSSAFEKCLSLTNVTIPNSVTSIESSTFSDCSLLTDVYYGSYGIDWLKANGRRCGIPDSATVHFKDDLYGKGECGINVNWIMTADGTLTISGTGRISNYISDYDYNNSAPWMWCRDDVKRLVIEDGVRGIGSYAFSGCPILTDVTISDSVTSIGDWAFGSSGLTSVTIPTNVTSIGNCAFCWCSSLTSVTIPSSVTSIGERAFSSCHALIGVTIPDSVTDFGIRVFCDCSTLKSVTFSGGVTSIAYEMFEGCASLTNITIPDSVTSIQTGAFKGCTSLTTLTIPDSVTSIGWGAFENCTSLTGVKLPSALQSIYSETFSNCVRLTRVTIPKSVTSIGEKAFYYCDSLTDVHYGGSKADWAKITIKDGNEDLLNATLHVVAYPIPADVTLTGAKADSDGITVTWAAAEHAVAYKVLRKTADSEWTVVAEQITATSYKDKTAKAGVKYTYTVQGVNADGKTSASYDTTGVSAVVAYPIPADVTLTGAKADSDGITVTWAAAEHAVAYKVLRKTADSEWTVVAEQITATSYKDKTAKAGVKYIYTVQGVNADGKTSAGYDTTGVSATIPAAPTPTTPANVTLGSAKVSGSTIVVTWQAANGAEQYRVYRKDAVNTKWKGIATVTGTSWTDKTAQAGVKYTYTVRGISANGTLSPSFDTTGVSATIPAAPTPTTPANVTLGSAKVSGSTIVVTWQAANGAAQYRVYRKDAANPKWKGIANATGTSWTDKTAQAGVKYTYTVRGISANGTLSPGFDTTGVSATIPAAPTPTTPANVTLGSAKVSGSTIVVTWQAANGAEQYRVYRKDAANPKWKGIATVTGTSWTDKTAQAGVKYTYTVRGISANGTLSPGFDNTGVSATVPGAPTPAPTTPAEVTLIGAVAGSDGITVKWKAAAGAKEYRVYRKGPGETKWKGLVNVTGISWTDRGVKAGAKYTYTVRGIGADGKTLSPTYNNLGVSTTATVTPVPITPANVTLIGATAGSSGIQVTWKTAAGAEKYRVYRIGPGDAKWVGLANVTGTGWTDTNVKAGVKYTYTVRGISVDGKLSPGFDKTGVSAVAK